MVTKEEFMNGVLSYADAEVMPYLPTIGKWGIGTAITLMHDKASTLIDSLMTNPLIKSMDIISEDGLIDEQRLLHALKDNAQQYGNLEVAVPIVGTLKFTTSDIDKLYNHIKGGSASR